MAYTYTGAHVKANGGGGNTTTGTLNSTGADLLIAVVSMYGGRAVDYTVSDSKSNSWSSAPASWNFGTDTLGVAVKIFYCKPTSVGSGHTFTITGVNGFGSIAVSCFTSAQATPIDQSNSNNNNGAAGTTLTTGSITPSENNELIIAGFGAYDDTGNTISINGGFTITDTQLYGGGGAGAGVASAYLIQTSLAAANPTWTDGSNSVSHMGSAIASFKAAAVAGGVVKTVNSTAIAGIKTINGLAVASVKTLNGAAYQ